ncbi:LysE/ArgO family amino acid transporter [Protaetiibacter intestinalis]|uniref:Amino acid transporter n=1 Tax=Protaetiibacter intestinalis TaxID=2419774 RepID=A0A387BAJ5_9MICO|nr:LysE family transporter [Protaetiibacter intestinalis]AYF98156.1 amino acid transporter [Protaetiibacter intestinalis]
MTASAALAAALAGLGLGFATIVAIGAQNTFVLRQGLRREHVVAIVAICALSDVALIALGIAGTGAVLQAAPWLVTAVRIGGAVFLASYGVLAARRALRRTAQALEVTDAPDAAARRRSLLTAVATCLAVTWLNPHVYLDIAIIGTIANGHGDGRWLFGAGIVAASVLWFTTLGFGARALAPVFARPLAWRILDGAIAAVMLTLAVLVALPLLAPR